MERYLEESIRRDMAKKIIILSGPRQVGKTTLSKQLVPSFVYLNYDSGADRRMILDEEWPRDTPLVIFDELHKLKKWKSKIKGIYDTDGIPPSLLVTGSARLETARKAGDSLAGRFFAYRLHPLTVREIAHGLKEPLAIALEKMLRLGGFPEPYLLNDETHAKRWRRTHLDTIIRSDLLDLERAHEREEALDRIGNLESQIEQNEVAKIKGKFREKEASLFSEENRELQSKLEETLAQNMDLERKYETLKKSFNEVRDSLTFLRDSCKANTTIQPIRESPE